MVERHAQFSAEEDPTIRIDAKHMKALEEQPLAPGESRTFLPAEPGQEESVAFHVTQEKLVNGSDPVPFSLHADTNGQWVVETPVLQGESWTLPPDIEFTIDMSGVGIRTKEEVAENVSPRILPVGSYPSLIVQLMATQARDAGTGHPGFTFLAHRAEEGDGAYLSVKNVGRDTVTMEKTVLDATPEEEFQGSEDKTIVVGREAVRAADKPGEATQEVDMKPLLADEQIGESNPTEASEEEAAIAETSQEDHTAEADAKAKTAVEADEPEEVIPDEVKVRVRLEGISVEDALAEYAAAKAAEHTEEDEEEKTYRRRLELEREEELPGVIDKIVTYIQEEIDYMRTSTKEGLRDDTKGVVPALKRVYDMSKVKDGQLSVASSGLLEAAKDLQTNFGEYITEFGQMREAIKEYFREEEDIFKPLVDEENEISEEEANKKKIRREVVDAMEDLDEMLGKVDAANQGTLELTSKLLGNFGEDTVGIKYNSYDDLPQYPVMHELGNSLRKANVQIRAMQEYLSAERVPAVAAALAQLEVIKQIRNRLQGATEA